MGICSARPAIHRDVADARASGVRLGLGQHPRVRLQPDDGPERRRQLHGEHTGSAADVEQHAVAVQPQLGREHGEQLGGVRRPAPQVVRRRPPVQHRVVGHVRSLSVLSRSDVQGARRRRVGIERAQHRPVRRQRDRPAVAVAEVPTAEAARPQALLAHHVDERPVDEHLGQDGDRARTARPWPRTIRRGCSPWPPCAARTALRPASGRTCRPR